MDTISRPQILIPAVLGVISITYLLSPFLMRTPSTSKYIKAPDPTLPSPYPLSLYENAESINTPYGSIRTSCFGPRDGEKILFIHGITTPSPVFEGIAKPLAKAGYRVCVFDLWGRGFSDSPSLPHDDRLYAFQIQAVLLHHGWSSAHFVGYSLGGCIAASFVKFFPRACRGLVFIAPAGLLEKRRTSLFRRMALHETVPTFLVQAISWYLVPRAKEQVRNVQDTTLIAVDGGEEGQVDVTEILAWQASNHAGFGNSYLSSFRYAPIFDQIETFEALDAQEREITAIWGECDDVVDTFVVGGNFKRACPKAKVVLVPGAGHDICTSRPSIVVALIEEALKRYEAHEQE